VHQPDATTLNAAARDVNGVAAAAASTKQATELNGTATEEVINHHTGSALDLLSLACGGETNAAAAAAVAAATAAGGVFKPGPSIL
jgi:hypothetical protein